MNKRPQQDDPTAHTCVGCSDWCTCQDPGECATCSSCRREALLAGQYNVDTLALAQGLQWCAKQLSAGELIPARGFERVPSTLVKDLVSDGHGLNFLVEVSEGEWKRVIITDP